MRRFASLRRQADFARLRRRGRRASSPILTLYRGDALPGDGGSLVGITVNKSIGKAVVRNKVRRRLAAIVDDALEGQPPMRLLVIPQPAAAQAGFAALRAEMNALMERVR
jgi:ribonuclease P protein component